MKEKESGRVGQKIWTALQKLFEKAETLGMQQTCSKQGSWLLWDVHDFGSFNSRVDVKGHHN
jgi:hypothetical protein